MTNYDVTLGELLELQRSIPRGGSSFYVESSLLARMLAELIRMRTAVEPTPECASCKDWLAMGKLYCGDCGRQIPQWATTANRSGDV